MYVYIYIYPILEGERSSSKEFSQGNKHQQALCSLSLSTPRTNNLNLNDRRRFQNEDTSCIMCGAAEESLEHFLLHCSHCQRAAALTLQQSYHEECSLPASSWDTCSLPTHNITNICSTKCGRRGRRRKTNNNKDALEENTA